MRSAWSLAAAALLLACGGPRTPVVREDAPELVGVWYTVRPGDSVAGIAKAHGVPLEDILELNDLPAAPVLQPGQALFLYGIDELVRRRPEAPSPAAGPKAEAPDLEWPLAAGTVSSAFGPRWGRMHKGIDIAAPSGTPVHAAADGKVIYSDDGWRGYGNLVVIRHRGGVVTVYAHNRANLVDEGDDVRQGARIAEVGSTGHSTGPHLHFEVRVKGAATDPLVHLPAR